MSDPLAFFLTWTTYGTWLRGDERGWTKPGSFAVQGADPQLRTEQRVRMIEPPLTLTDSQRKLVDETIRKHCTIRGWDLFAVNVRTNHVHLVVAGYRDPDEIMSQFKAWCSRRLKQHQRDVDPDSPERTRWWTEGGSTQWIDDEEHLTNAIHYVLEGQ